MSVNQLSWQGRVAYLKVVFATAVPVLELRVLSQYAWACRKRLQAQAGSPPYSTSEGIGDAQGRCLRV